MSSVSSADSANHPSVLRHSKSRSLERLRPLRCLGNWQLTELISRNNFTDVFLAKPLGCRPNWPADYAVKVVRAAGPSPQLAAELLEREVEVASQVSQQHLLAILEAHTENTAEPFFVMPRLEGESVDRVIRKTGYLSVRQSLWIVRQASEALGALHTADWLHGDVKPGNIMVSSTGHVTLIDLGFAAQKQSAMVTEARAASGTLTYVAPETMTSAYCSDERSDIYSLGITLFEMLTGRQPFESTHAGTLIESHRSRPLPDPREFRAQIPDGVVRLLSRMTAKQPLRRPQSVRELVSDLLPLEVAAMKYDRIAS